MSASADDSTGVQAPGGLAPVTAGPIMGGNDRETERHRIPAMTPSPLDPSLPARPREFHRQLLLAGTPPNALLSLPDERILYLAAILRDTLVPAPALLLEEWQSLRGRADDAGRAADSGSRGRFRGGGDSFRSVEGADAGADGVPYMSGSSTDCGAKSTVATNGERPQTDSDKPVQFVDLHLCESEDSPERTGLLLVVVRHDGSHPAALRHL